MVNLHLRDVPEETVSRLREIAKVRRTSMNAVAVAELIAGVRAEANAGLLSELPNLEVDVASIVEDLQTARSDRG